MNTKLFVQLCFCLLFACMSMSCKATTTENTSAPTHMEEFSLVPGTAGYLKYQVALIYQQSFGTSYCFNGSVVQIISFGEGRELMEEAGYLAEESPALFVAHNPEAFSVVVKIQHESGTVVLFNLDPSFTERPEVFKESSGIIYQVGPGVANLPNCKTCYESHGKPPHTSECICNTYSYHFCGPGPCPYFACHGCANVALPWADKLRELCPEIEVFNDPRPLGELKVGDVLR